MKLFFSEKKINIKQFEEKRRIITVLYLKYIKILLFFILKRASFKCNDYFFSLKMLISKCRFDPVHCFLQYSQQPTFMQSSCLKKPLVLYFCVTCCYLQYFFLSNLQRLLIQIQTHIFKM